jgi:hypothetical protein
MICSAFSVDPGLKPPPPDYPVGKGAARDAAPRGKKVHGDYITWNQEPSTLEDADTSQRQKKKVSELRRCIVLLSRCRRSTTIDVIFYNTFCAYFGADD